MQSMTASLAYLTQDLPGIGGVIKERPEDFLVEEQPAYAPVGEGEHLMLFMEKREVTTSDAVRRLAQVFHVRRQAIGYAGLKDKHAITRQHFTVHLPDREAGDRYLENIEFTRLKLIWAVRHTNKLRRGHLKGNRFVIRIRRIEATDVIRVKPILDQLVDRGVPNYLGDQRFGSRQVNHELGRHFLMGQWQAFLDLLLGDPRETDSDRARAGRFAYERGDYEEALSHWPKQQRHDRQALDALRQGKSLRDAVMSIDAQQREFLLSSLQSALFNRVLDLRCRSGLINQLIEGDLAWKHDSRAVFSVDATSAEKENGQHGRAHTFDVSPSGPMWGQGMLRAGGQVARIESQVLDELGLTEDMMGSERHGGLHGSRRAMRMPVRDVDLSGGADEHGPYIRLSFELPRGSFATVLLREIMKNDDQMRSYMRPRETIRPSQQETT